MVLGPPLTPSHPNPPLKITGWLDCCILPVLDPESAFLFSAIPEWDSSHRSVTAIPQWDSNHWSVTMHTPKRSWSAVAHYKTVLMGELKTMNFTTAPWSSNKSKLQNSSNGRTENNDLYSSSMIFEWVKITKQFSPHPPQMGQTEVVSGLARLSPHAAHVCWW